MDVDGLYIRDTHHGNIKIESIAGTHFIIVATNNIRFWVILSMTHYLLTLLNLYLYIKFVYQI